MSLNIRPREYTQWHSPLQTIVEFFKVKLADLGWDRAQEEDLVMDVGCGPGRTTKDLVLPFFPKVQKIIALDLVPDMINIAREINAHPRIEYVVADISDWSTVQEWEGKIAKIISIHCMHWVKYPDQAFQNIYRLLKSGGEATIYFTMQASLFDVVERLQNNPKWSHYLKDHDNHIPDSHRYKYDAAHYKTYFGAMGFEVLFCNEEEKYDVCANEQAIKNFCTSLCVLEPFIPEEYKEEFKEDLVQELIKIGGRTESGNPRHVGKILEIIIKKI